MKKIVINGRFLLHKVTGVERYAMELISALDNIVKVGEVELAIPPEVKDFPHYKNITVVRVGRFHNRLWEHLSFPFYVKREKAISLNLCNVAPLLSPDIVCIHDVKVRAHPEFYNRFFLIWYRILFLNETKRAKKIITVSDFSKKEICKYYNISSERIYVVPNSWEHFFYVKFDEEALNKYCLEKYKFYFSISSLEPNKNLKWIADKARECPKDVFVIAGAINKAIFSDCLGFDCPDNMKLIGFVSDEDAKTLMKYCKAFLFPSIYEGFGIPPLEAMSAGCRRIVVSDSEVMHEIFGNSVEYINGDSNSFDSNETSRVLEKYSWKKSALLLKKIISDI